MLATSAPAFAVVDSGMQPEASVLPRLVSAVAHEGNDLAVGKRYSECGSTGDWDASREKINRLATWASGLVMKARLSDPMSGFFAIRREVLVDALPRLSNIGFKILMDLVASASRPLKVKEIPYTFRNRLPGASKRNSRLAQDVVNRFMEKKMGGVVRIR